VKDRKVADRLLYSMLLEAGIPKARAAAVYAGVRLFGKSHHCNEEKRDHTCGSPLIRFQEVSTSTYRRRGSLQSVLALPTFELQALRLTSMTQEDKDAAREEIEKLFPEDSDAVKRELDQDNP